MKPTWSAGTRQQRRVLKQAEKAAACGFFNLLTSPEVLADLDSLLHEHRGRCFRLPRHYRCSWRRRSRRTAVVGRWLMRRSMVACQRRLAGSAG